MTKRIFRHDFSALQIQILFEALNLIKNNPKLNHDPLQDIKGYNKTFDKTYNSIFDDLNYIINKF